MNKGEKSFVYIMFSVLLAIILISMLRINVLENRIESLQEQVLINVVEVGAKPLIAIDLRLEQLETWQDDIDLKYNKFVDVAIDEWTSQAKTNEYMLKLVQHMPELWSVVCYQHPEHTMYCGSE